MDIILYKFTININIPIEQYEEILTLIFWSVVGYSIIFSIILMISLFNIFKKENIKPIYALIPFYNIYHYFKITKTPFWLIFIPLLNILTLVIVTYRLAKIYECHKWVIYLSIPFCFVILPYIAFSKKKNKRFKYESNPLKSILEIDNIDNKYLEEEIENLIFDDYYATKISSDSKFNSNIDTMIHDIEAVNEIEDQFFLEQSTVSSLVTSTSENKTELATANNDNNEIEDVSPHNISDDEMLELFDNVPETLTAHNIETIENKLQENNIKIIDNAEYKELEMKQMSNEAIAFGGEEHSKVILEGKTNEFLCKRCGSNLVGATNICPGCGMNLKNTSN